MGIHSRNRPRGRTIAKGALALGATLTGFGLSAAAFDSGGVAQAESSGAPAASGINQYGYSGSGLGAPVAIADVVTPTGPIGPVLGVTTPGRPVTPSVTSHNAPPSTGRHAAPTTPATAATPPRSTPPQAAVAPPPQTRQAPPPTTTTSATTGTKPGTGSASTTTPATTTKTPPSTTTPTTTPQPTPSTSPLVSDLSAVGSLLGKLPIVGSLLKIT